ncbi:Calmodulin-binding transcription activator 2 [Eumeta japonica]|uniref:Calmodulin-binding transcription activator 2 n=1 Tax=Eumeta variegata TaxID=151549 RepID=A0A4C1XFV6_EUMVA|nr:Calmodulin-binding transcription activator 2 [Eumeta japonica]
MRASAAGHTDTALVLARWSAGWMVEAGAGEAVSAARGAGHARLAAMLERIHPPRRDGVFLRPDCFTQKGRAASVESNLVKRPSIDSGINMADAFRSTSAADNKTDKTARWERSMSLPLDSDTSEDSFGDTKIGRRMDLALLFDKLSFREQSCRIGWVGVAVVVGETADGRAESPLIDVEALSDAAPSPPPEPAPGAGEQDDRVFTLAEQIIAAMPERIKNESSSLLSGCGLEGGSGSGEDTLMAPLLDDTTAFHSEFSFEFCDNTYRYCGGSTPCSSGSVSPGSALSPPPPSPRAPAPPAHAATLQEFLNATTHFSSLTLNDREQRELYSAAMTIQKAYRQYRGRQLQRRAAAAALTIQNCYRRYKQFAYLKQMHAAATIIQQSYRSYRARRRSNTTSQGSLLKCFHWRQEIPGLSTTKGEEYECGLKMDELSVKCLLYADDQVILAPPVC